MKPPRNRPNSSFSKPRHRFNRAGDLADSLADALFSRDTRQLERQRRSSHGPAVSSNSDRSSRQSQHLPKPSTQNSSLNRPDTQSDDSNNPINPPINPDNPVNDTARIWEACFTRALGNDAPNRESLPSGQVDQLAQLIWVDGDEAVVYAQSPVWATRVRMLAPSLVACMRQCGLADVSRLRVRVQPTETVPVPRPANPPVLSAESAEILSEAADRADEGLANRLRKLARHARKTD